jgi:DNA invertase Pin-like site-specific DNA recombinase
MARAKQFISYIRVSTKRQGESGLGLEAQQSAVASHINAQGGKLVREYREIESGNRSNNRPAFNNALCHAKRCGATLLVAKLDRLARNVAFTSALMEAGVDFICCDNPHATRFTIHILAAVAEFESEQISIRTKAALAALKARGVKLGSDRPGHWTKERKQKRLEALERGRIKAVQTNKAKAGGGYKDLLPYMFELREAGNSLSQVAATLNEQGHTTTRKTPFTPPTVKRIMDRGSAAQ